jgi:hypothetical protein
MSENHSFDDPPPARMKMSLGSLTDHLNTSSSKLFFLDSSSVDSTTSQIEINFDCQLDFDPLCVFSGFDIVISNCSVIIHNIPFHGKIKIDHSFVQFHDCALLESEKDSINSSSQSHLIVTDCRFMSVRCHPIVTEDHNQIIFCRSRFSQSKLDVRIHHYCRISIMDCQFSNLTSSPLQTGKKATAPNVNTLFSECNRCLLIGSESTVKILSIEPAQL